jgi:ABC-type phosphate/phosphonate transport system substrate-binding protein
MDPRKTKMEKKALLLISAIFVLLLSTGCGRARSISSQNSQPAESATSISASAAPAEIIPTQAADSAPTAAVPADVAQATKDLGQDLDKALNDLDTTDALNDLP